MSAEPITIPRHTCPTPPPIVDERLFLKRFDVRYADLVTCWPRTPRELTWLAPGTPPPLTAEKVLGWARPSGDRFLLWSENRAPLFSFDGVGPAIIFGDGALRVRQSGVERKFAAAGAGAARSIGYAELNPMDGDPQRLWIGHFILSPDHRRRAAGVRFMRLLLQAAFARAEIEEVLLVVFPENERALRCYRRAGFVTTGRESKYFPETRQRHEFARMAIHRSRYEHLRFAGPLPLGCADE